MNDQKSEAAGVRAEQAVIEVDYGKERAKLLAGLRLEIELFRYLHGATDDVPVVEVIQNDRQRFELVSQAPHKLTLQERTEDLVIELLVADLSDEADPKMKAYDIDTDELLESTPDPYGVRGVHDLLYEVTQANTHQ